MCQYNNVHFEGIFNIWGPRINVPMFILAKENLGDCRTIDKEKYF